MDTSKLKQIPIFSNIDDAVLTDLATIVEEKQYNDGDSVFSEGDDGDAMYVISEGSVKIVKIIDKEKGLSKDLAIIGAGDFFGEMSLIDQSPRSAGVVSVGTSTLARITREAFNGLLEKSAVTAANLLFGIIQTVSGRLRLTNSELVVLYEAGKTIGEAEELKELVSVIFKRLVQTTAASHAMFLMRNEFSGAIDAYDEHGYEPGKTSQCRLADDEGLIGIACSKNESILVSDFDTDERFKDTTKAGFEMPSMIIVPMQAKDKILGILVMAHTEKNKFTPNNLNLCIGVASQVAQGVLNARHREEEASRDKLNRHYVKF